MIKAVQLASTGEADERCENCVFFKLIIEDDSFRGHCLRYPPQINNAFIALELEEDKVRYRSADEAVCDFYWLPWHFEQPQVHFDDYCGEFRKRPQAQQEPQE